MTRTEIEAAIKAAQGIVGHDMRVLEQIARERLESGIMTPFLVEAEIVRTSYMNSSDEPFWDRRLVMAVDAAEARQKHLAFWEKKNSEYAVSYDVRVEVRETVV